MSPLDRHLTTEQLSALLDNQLSPEESEESYQAHLQTCEQCQQELAALRQTARLLREMPQPPLPRSFTLPATFALESISPEADVPEDERTSEPVSPLPIRRIGQSTLATPRRRRLLTTMRLVGGLVAVLGVGLVFIALLTFAKLGGSNSGGVATSSEQPGAKTANGTHYYDQASPTTGTTPQIKPAATTQIPIQSTPAVQSNPGQDSDGKQQNGVPSISILFDLGILLLVLIVLGFFLFRLLKKRSRLRDASSDQE